MSHHCEKPTWCLILFLAAAALGRRPPRTVSSADDSAMGVLQGGQLQNTGRQMSQQPGIEGAEMPSSLVQIDRGTGSGRATGSGRPPKAMLGGSVSRSNSSVISQTRGASRNSSGGPQTGAEMPSSLVQIDRGTGSGRRATTGARSTKSPPARSNSRGSPTSRGGPSQTGRQQSRPSTPQATRNNGDKTPALTTQTGDNPNAGPIATKTAELEQLNTDLEAMKNDPKKKRFVNQQNQKIQAVQDELAELQKSGERREEIETQEGELQDTAKREQEDAKEVKKSIKDQWGDMNKVFTDVQNNIIGKANEDGTKIDPVHRDTRDIYKTIINGSKWMYENFGVPPGAQGQEGMDALQEEHQRKADEKGGNVAPTGNMDDTDPLRDVHLANLDNWIKANANLIAEPTNTQAATNVPEKVTEVPPQQQKTGGRTTGRQTGRRG